MRALRPHSIAPAGAPNPSNVVGIGSRWSSASAGRSSVNQIRLSAESLDLADAAVSGLSPLS
jgi:hypothetical protein